MDIVSQELISYEPATGAELWRGPIDDAEAEVALAREGWRPWAARPVTNRIEAVRRFANVVRGKADAFADLIARETGKPLWETKTEVASVIAKVDISVKAYAERTGHRTLDGDMGQRNRLRHRPHGVLAVLGPYNFPAHLPNGHIVPALIAGNAVVFKPSEKTPATGAFLVDCYHEAGIPPDVIRLVIGGVDQGRALTNSPGVNGVLFTGSATTGVKLARQFADQPGKMLALEMGGNNPIVAWNIVDPAAAAALIVQSAYMSSGQRCTAARRLIVEDGRHQPLVDALVALIRRLRVGGPHDDPAPFMGPVIDNAAATALQDGFVSLITKGGRPIVHLERPDAAAPFLSPALIDVTDARDRPDEELFGPILQLVRVPDFDAALAEANDTRFGLSAALIGGDPALWDRFWNEAQAGIVNWNRPTTGASSAAPFGGTGLSGNHRPSAFYAADYCAYPVVSSEVEQPRAVIGIGLKDG